MSTPLNIWIQYCVPQHTLSRLTGLLGECRWKWFKNWAIKRLIRKYHVNLSEAVSTNLDDYPNFNSFFTRHLKPELRPIAKDPNHLVSPADGCISQIGHIDKDRIFQAKNYHYSLTTLLGGSPELANFFNNGNFATIYLAPKDYHRVHMPFAGTLKETIYIPGQLFSVNQYTTSAVPNLFARNERLVCIFDTTAGPMAVILVGAMLVGNIQTVWPMPNPSKKITTQHYQNGIHLERGAELGFFKMGSTVIVLFAKDKMEWLATLQANNTVQMGQSLGETRKG